MKLKLHHVNFATTDVPAMDAFYRDVLDMQTMPGMDRTRVKDQGYPGDVAFVTDGAMQMHIAEKDMNIGFRTGKVVNPVQRGHIAFRTDDLDAFKKRLEAGFLLRSRWQRRRSAPGTEGRALALPRRPRACPGDLA